MLHKFVSFIKLVYDILDYKYDHQFMSGEHLKMHSLIFDDSVELNIFNDNNIEDDGEGGYSYRGIILYFINSEDMTKLVPPNIVEQYYRPINKIFHEYKIGIFKNTIHFTATKLIDELMEYSPEELKLYINMLCGV